MGDVFDCCVIGGGPGGYVAAIRSAQCGLKTLLLEREQLGGICLNWGCIPTKSLLRSSEVLHLAQNASAFGVSVKGEVKADLDSMVKRSRKVSESLNRGVEMLLKKNGVVVHFGSARLGDVKGEVILKPASAPEQQFKAKHIIVATGARSRSLPGLDFSHPLVWDYKDAMIPKEQPKKLLVLGAGAIGVEFCYFYQSLGCQVVLVEALDKILPVEDKEVSLLLAKELKKKGVEVLTSHRFVSAKLDGKQAEVTLESAGKQIIHQADKIIVAVGVSGNTENLNLDKHGVKLDRSIIQTIGFGRTHADGIYAIGDVAGPPMLAHKAEHEGVICVEKIAGLPDVQDTNKDLIPGCTFCHPQVASVGLTEDKAKEWAKEHGETIRVGRFPYHGNGKAISMGETVGFIKTIFAERSGRLIGAHMIGAEVSELIQGFVVAMGLETTEKDLMNMVFPHPTLSEMMRESVLSAFDEAIHI